MFNEEVIFSFSRYFFTQDQVSFGVDVGCWLSRKVSGFLVAIWEIARLRAVIRCGNWAQYMYFLFGGSCSEAEITKVNLGKFE